MPAFNRYRATALAVAATMMALPSSAQDRPQRSRDELTTAIHKAGEKQDPIVSKSDKALIAKKCGYAPDWDEKNITINDGVLICSDGKKISDDETRAMAHRVSERASRYVDGIMRDPAVKRAIDGTAQRAAAEAIERAQKSLVRAGLAKR